MNKMIYLPESKLQSNFKKHINKVTLLLFFLFYFFPTTTFAQTTDTFTSTGSWTVPGGVTSVTVQIWGAGGGGGGSNVNKDGGSGGGSGAYVTRVIPVTPGSYAFTIGTGGIGGAASSGTGATGGNSTITIGGFTLTANGGTGGAGNEGAVGNGGTASGGSTNTNGNPGISGTTSGNIGAKGGDAPNGGIGGNGGNGGAGADGNTPGAGGGGGEEGAGGAGARGEIRFTYTAASYCSIGTTSSTYWITNFTTTGGTLNINNTSTYSAGGYGNFTAQTVSKTSGSSFNFNTTTSSSTHGINIWVDWNNDLDFDDAGEKVYASGGYVSSASGTITIPVATPAGNYRMRLVADYLATDPTACGTKTYTEAEDYTVQVLAPAACSGTPTAGTTTTLPGSGNPGSTYTVSATGFTNATGLTFQWQYSTNGGGSWTNQGAASGTYSNYTATAPALGITTLWRLIVTCTSSGLSATSSNGTFISVSTLNIPTTGNNTVTCGTNIVLYDNGGSTGDYANSSTGYTVLEAGLGATINISGNYATESTYDYIRIYNGTGTGGTLLTSFSGTGTINYTGTVGQTLTVQFYSDSSTFNSGFSLSVTYGGTCFPVCAGTPSGGTATTSPVSGNPGSAYTVSATGYTGATGLTFQWQYSTNGGGLWTNAGAASGTYSNYAATAPALGITTLWRLNVTCTNSGLSANSTSATFTSVSTQNVPTSGNNTVTCGTNIVLYDNGGNAADYSNSSTGYTILEAGLGATINISGNYVTESGLDYIRIYNGTGTGGTLLASYSGTGTINYTGTAGQTLTVQFYSDGSVAYSGFSLSISYSGVCFPACAGTPTAGTVTTSPNTGWPGSSYSVIGTGYTQALNMTYQWQYSSNAGGPWTNAGAATSSYANYSATAPASGIVYWHLVVTCTNSSQTTTSSNGTFTTMAVSDVVTGCPNVVSGGLGLSGADPAAINCTASSTCVDLEANYLDLGQTTSYIVEPIAYNPPRSYTGLANPVSVNTDDVWSPVVNLPFDFCFYGNTYNRCVIGSNGILSFNTALAGTSSGYLFNNNIPISGNSVLRENSIFGVFHDINPGVGTMKQVGWELITLPTGCRALVASWSNVPMFDENAILYTGMMVLYENSNIIEVYIKEKNIDNFGAGTWNDGNAIVGIQNSTGTLASVAPGRNGLDPNWSASNEAWRFVPNGTSIASIAWHQGAGTAGPIVGTTPILNVCPTSTTTYTAEITYTLCDGRTIKESDQTTVTINGAKVWNGSVSTNWNIANNWTPSGVPTSLDCVVIPNVTNDPIIGGTNFSGLGLNLAVNTDAILNVTPSNTLKITDVINVNPTGTIIVQDDASIVQVNNVTNTGNIQYKRTANVRRQDYVYWSSPVASFSNSAVSPGTSLGFQYKWIPTIGTNTNGFGNWTYANETMVLGKGYCLRAPDSYSLSALTPFTATFIGVPNNGNLSIPISRGIYNTAATYSTGTSSTLGTRDDDNWNLVGNPYPSAIHAIDFLTLNPNIAGFVNIWTHGTLPSSAIVDPFYADYAYNYTPTDYITYNSVGTSAGPGVFNGRITGGQGFFVSMIHGGATTQNLIFNNTLRSNTYDNTVFYKSADEHKSTDELEKHRIWFDLVTPSGTSARSLLGYVENATNESDRLFDAFSNEKLSFNIFSLIDEERMLIQGRKLPFDNNDKVNIGVSLPQDGFYKIALSSVDGLFSNPNQNIYVEDKLLNVIYNLKDAPYSFMGNKGNITDRFILRYTKSDKITEITNQLNVYDNNVLTVESSKLKIKDIIVFDTLGKLLLNKNNVNEKNYQITNLNRTNSMLIVKVTLEDNTQDVRKIIY